MKNTKFNVINIKSGCYCIVHDNKTFNRGSRLDIAVLVLLFAAKIMSVLIGQVITLHVGETTRNLSANFA